jgi:hypothetical protein
MNGHRRRDAGVAAAIDRDGAGRLGRLVDVAISESRKWAAQGKKDEHGERAHATSSDRGQPLLGGLGR